MKITKASVVNLTLPIGKREVFLRDDDIPGFGVRLRLGGSKTWIFQYRQGTKQRRMTLGSVNAITLEDMRR
jgi:Arm DNA-binding domain